jgi:hypothetical protein
LCEELELLQHLCQRGCVVCLDGIGCAGTYLPRVDVTCPADDRISLCVAALVRAGFVDQIVVSPPSHVFFIILKTPTFPHIIKIFRMSFFNTFHYYC